MPLPSSSRRFGSPRKKQKKKEPNIFSWKKGDVDFELEFDHKNKQLVFVRDATQTTKGGIDEWGQYRSPATYINEERHILKLSDDGREIVHKIIRITNAGISKEEETLASADDFDEKEWKEFVRDFKKMLKNKNELEALNLLWNYGIIEKNELPEDIYF